MVWQRLGEIGAVAGFATFTVIVNTLLLEGPRNRIILDGHLPNGYGTGMATTGVPTGMESTYPSMHMVQLLQ